MSQNQQAMTQGTMISVPEALIPDQLTSHIRAGFACMLINRPAKQGLHFFKSENQPLLSNSDFDKQI